MTLPFDKRKTLQELENSDWGEPEGDTITGLMIKCHRLRRKPLFEFTAGDCRFMLGQNIGLDYLVPLAIELLVENPFVKGNHFPGDLLLCVLRIDRQFWQQNPDLWREANDIIEEMKLIKDRIDKQILPLASVFQSNNPNQDVCFANE